MKKRLTVHQLLFEQQILGILLFSILVVFLWIISSIYFSYSTTTLTVDDTTTVRPLTPTINEKPLQDLNARKWWTAEELAQFSPSTTLDGKSLLPLPVSSISAQQVPQSASSSAQQ